MYPRLASKSQSFLPLLPKCWDYRHAPSRSPKLLVRKCFGPKIYSYAVGEGGWRVSKNCTYGIIWKFKSEKKNKKKALREGLVNGVSGEWKK
jgi:hypothetical protein